MLRDVATKEQLREFDRLWRAARTHRVLFDYFGGRPRPAGRRGPLFGDASLTSRQYMRKHAGKVVASALRAIAMNIPFEFDTPRNARLRELIEDCLECARFRKRWIVLRRLKEALPNMPIPAYLRRKLRFS